MGRQIKYGHLLHGGDYNPEQWLDRPDILEKDIEYFKKAKINTVSVGMFSWAMLEPEEVEPEVLRELMPMTSPLTFSSAPPELPALMAASV